MSPPKSLSLLLLGLSLSCSPLGHTASSDHQHDDPIHATTHESPVLSSCAKTNIDEKTVKEICDRIEPELCMTVVMSSASGPLAATDYPTVLRLAIQGGISGIQAITDLVKMMAKYSKWDQRTRLSLDLCVEGFERAISDFQEANKAIEENNGEAVLSALNGAVPHYELCSDGFPEDDKESVVSEYQDMMDKMTSVTLGMASIMWRDEN